MARIKQSPRPRLPPAPQLPPRPQPAYSKGKRYGAVGKGDGKEDSVEATADGKSSHEAAAERGAGDEAAEDDAAEGEGNEESVAATADGKSSHKAAAGRDNANEAAEDDAVGKGDGNESGEAYAGGKRCADFITQNNSQDGAAGRYAGDGNENVPYPKKTHTNSNDVGTDTEEDESTNDGNVAANNGPEVIDLCSDSNDSE